MSRKMNEEGLFHCPNCGGSRVAVDEESGEKVCMSCGLVLPAEGVVGAEGDREGREEDGLGSGGLGYRADHTGREMALRVRERMRRLRSVGRETSAEGRERRSLKMRAVVLAAVERLGLPASYAEDALELLRDASRVGATSGRSMEVCAATSVYILAKQRGATRTMREVAKGLGIDFAELRRCHSSIIGALGMKLPTSDPRTYVSKYVPALGLGGETERRAIDVLLQVKGRREIAGKNPLALAAAAVYLASRERNERVSQRVVAHAFGVSDVALRNRLRDLEETLAEKATR